MIEKGECIVYCGYVCILRPRGSARLTAEKQKNRHCKISFGEASVYGAQYPNHGCQWYRKSWWSRTRLVTSKPCVGTTPHPNLPEQFVVPLLLHYVLPALHRLSTYGILTASCVVIIPVFSSCTSSIWRWYALGKYLAIVWMWMRRPSSSSLHAARYAPVRLCSHPIHDHFGNND